MFCGPCACLRADMKREKEGPCGLIERVVAANAQTHFGDVARVTSLRSNALWGRGGRRAGSVLASFAVVCALAASATAAGVGGGYGNGNGRSFGNLKSFVAPELLSAIQQNPKQSFDVILQGDPKTSRSHGFLQKVVQDKSGASDENVGAGAVKREFLSVSGGRLTLTGRQILRIAKIGLADSIVPNDTVQMSSLQQCEVEQAALAVCGRCSGRLVQRHAERTDDRGRRLGHRCFAQRRLRARSRSGEPRESPRQHADG